MSLVKVQGNASGTGTLTIAAPNTNSNFTLDIPTASGTLQVSGNPISGTTGTFSGTISGGSTVGVGGATPSASGAGITFPATQSASSDANTLDDYEEGTWTPTAYGGTSTGTTTYTNQTGTYTKVGNQVTASFRLNISNMTGTGELLIGGFPFLTNANEYLGACMTYNLDWPNAGSVVFYLGDNRAYAYIFISQDNGVWNACVVDATFNMIATVTYLTT